MERTGHLRHHPGQIAFPGGGAEPADADIVTTALREATEEAGIPAAAVDVVGVLPPFLTAISDNWLTPVIGLQEGDIELHPDPFEVASLFHIDLATLMEAPHMVRTLTHKGEQRDVHYFDAAGHVVWGVTGAIVAELIRRIRVLGE
jgi:8-oxo-dGTP pyrophosphatase MutT (NUDIX family)